MANAWLILSTHLFHVTASADPSAVGLVANRAGQCNGNALSNCGAGITRDGALNPHVDDDVAFLQVDTRLRMHADSDANSVNDNIQEAAVGMRSDINQEASRQRVNHIKLMAPPQDKTGLFYTGHIPEDLALPTRNCISRPAGSVWYLVAMTDDGGPFATLFDQTQTYAEPQLARLRNFHESYAVSSSGGTLCMHWQRDNHYDAEWQHTCFSNNSPVPFIAGQTYTGTGGPVTLMQAAGGSWSAGAGVHTFHCGECDGVHFMINLVNLPAAKGVEVLQQGSPKFSEKCFNSLKDIVKERGLEDWQVVRANTDPERPITDFPH